MQTKDAQIWLDGEFVPWEEATVHVLCHTLHYGLGVFEGIRAYKTASGTAVFRLREHIARLFRSAHILRLSLPFDRETLELACLDTVRRNRLDSGYIRPMCFCQSANMGLHADRLEVHTMIAAWPWDAYLGAEGMEHGIRVKTSSHTRHHVNATLCKAKANGNYLNSILALQEAMTAGYDEALLLDSQGYVAEGSGENLFLVRDGTLLTPSLGSALEGITRDTVFHLAQDIGLAVQEKLLTRDEVYIADEAFFTGTAAEITPIRELDDRQIGDGRSGPITKRLQQDYFSCVSGENAAHQAWLSPV